MAAILDLLRAPHHDGIVSDEKDLRLLASSIFARLRADRENDDQVEGSTDLSGAEPATDEPTGQMTETADHGTMVDPAAQTADAPTDGEGVGEATTVGADDSSEGGVASGSLPDWHRPSPDPPPPPPWKQPDGGETDDAGAGDEHTAGGIVEDATSTSEAGDSGRPQLDDGVADANRGSSPAATSPSGLDVDVDSAVWSATPTDAVGTATPDSSPESTTPPSTEGAASDSDGAAANADGAAADSDGVAANSDAGPDTQRRHPGPIAHPLPRRFAIANQKGGVGKTTTAVNLGAALAELEYRVLVVDLDPQGNATTGLGINGRNLDSSIYDVMLHDVPIEDVIEATTLRNLFVVPATIDLAGAEIELVPVFSRELRLRRALDTLESDFDFVLIDCPPSLGLLTVNGLAAASEVVVPIQCEYYALEGLGQLLRNVSLVQANLNAQLEVSTIIMTMFDARTRLAEQVVAEVREHFGDRVCRHIVPRTVRLSEAPSFGQPIIVFDPSSRGSIAYRELAKEVSGGASQRTG
jgi:chromosome partitioning protein